jgi:hypothetical protein
MATEWTIETLKEHFESLLDEKDLRYTQKFESLDTALKVAASETDKKNTELNDVRHRFIPREVFDSYKEEQSKKSRATIIMFVLMGLSIIGLLLQVLK